MSSTAFEFDDFDEDEDVVVTDRVDPEQEDSYWRAACGREQYFDAGFDYEDYAPAYCVGYIGYAQYGGEFDDAEKSLCANWIRIKGDSRLTLEQAMPAMRAAWDRMAAQANRTEATSEPWLARLLSRQTSLPSIRMIPAMLR